MTSECLCHPGWKGDACDKEEVNDVDVAQAWCTATEGCAAFKLYESKLGGDSSYVLYSDAPAFAGQGGQGGRDYSCFALDSALGAERLKHEQCVAAGKAYECKLAAARDAGAGLAQDPGDDVYTCEYAGDASCEGGATCVCSSSRRRLLFATVPNKGKGEAAEECSCV
jgi:hypothetical protein